MKSFWLQLKPRERIIIAVAGGVLMILILYLALLEPYQLKVEKLNSRIAAQQTDVQWMNKTAGEIKQLQGSSTNRSSNTSGQSLMVVVDRTAKDNKLSSMVKRVEPDGSSRVRVWLEKAPFDDISKWLMRLETKHALSVESAVFDKTDVIGRVNARLVFLGAGA